MWIRSQDRKLLIDVDNIYVGGKGFEDKVEIYKIGEHFNYHLGWYSNEKKALKILDEIHDLMDANEYDISNLRVVYEMPLDEDVELDE